MSLPLSALHKRAAERKAKRKAKAKRLKLRRSPKAMIAKADRLFSLAVRSVGFCQSGRPEHAGPLQCAHGFSRRYRATRWDRRNAWALCAGCHKFYTHRPLEWDEWMRYRMGFAYSEVRAQALGPGKPDVAAILAGLQAAA